MKGLVEEFSLTEEHLSLYMEQKKVSRYRNGNKREPWDPFMKQSEEVQTKQLIHLELAYKFYLFDPSLSNTDFVSFYFIYLNYKEIPLLS